MPEPPKAKPTLDFNALYLDTNVLVRSGWPSPQPKLNNFLMLAKWWGVPVFLPEPVLIEAEEHWVRGVREKVAGLKNAAKQLERLAQPIASGTKVEHLPVERLVENYRTTSRSAIEKFQIRSSPFTNLSAKDMFRAASRYVLPFELGQEGKGFQDAVILSSILQHLNSNNDLNGIFVTDDQIFAKVRLADLEGGFADARLRILDLDSAFDLLWEPYWDETVRKPYAVERENAKTAAESAIPMLKGFIASQITESMLPAGVIEKVLKILSVRDVKVTYVQTPLPDPAHPDRQVQFAVGVSAEFTAIVEKDYSLLNAFYELKGEPMKPVQEEKKLTWLGGVEVTADVVDRQFKNLSPVSLLTVEQLGSERFWR